MTYMKVAFPRTIPHLKIFVAPLVSLALILTVRYIIQLTSFPSILAAYKLSSCFRQMSLFFRCQLQNMKLKKITWNGVT